MSEQEIKMQGAKKLTEKDKETLIRLAGDACEGCGKSKEKVKLHIHRIIRGHKGGTYAPHNCMIYCERCHKLIHGGEFK